MQSITIVNPQLEGSPFYWEGGPVGVLLSHGFTATTAEVRPLARILQRNGYTVAGPLLPGHYTQPEDLNRVRWQDWVAAVEDCYHELAMRCEKVWVGGESTGAVLALYLAACHPEITGVLAYAPAIRLNLSKFDLFRLYLLSLFLPYVPKAKGQRETAWQGYPVNPLKGAIQLLRLQKTVLPVLGRIFQPVLIVQGKLDATVHPTAPLIITQGIASETKEVYWMEDSTHVVCLDCELEQVAKITLDFMRRIVDAPHP
jgi:carboxylesterase